MPAKWTYGAGSVITKVQNNNIILASVTVPVTAEDVRPSGFVYVADWGNDSLGNGSRLRPYATVLRAFQQHPENLYVILNGVLRGTTTAVARTGAVHTSTMIGDGYAVLDGYTLGQFINSNYMGYKDLEIRGFSRTAGNWGTSYLNCVVKDVAVFNLGANTSSTWQNSLFVNCTGSNTALLNVNGVVNCTFYNVVVDFNGNMADALYNTWKNIWVNSTVFWRPATVTTFNWSYSLYYNTRFRFGTATSYTTVTGIEQLKTLLAAGGFSSATGLEYSRVEAPQFVSEAAQDFSLRPTSPAVIMSHERDFIGKHGMSLAQTLSEVVYSENITIANGRATLTDNTQDGLLRFAVQDLGVEYELGAPLVAGVMADRNGEYFDASRNLAETPVTPGGAMTAGTSYVVEAGTVNYNTNMLPIGTRFACVASALTFTSTEGGVVREITEGPNRLALRMKTHRSQGDQATFEAMPWMLYEIGKPMLSNRQGDIGTGTILRGNADPDFNRDPAKTFVVFARYRQVEIVVRVKNLPSAY